MTEASVESAPPMRELATTLLTISELPLMLTSDPENHDHCTGVPEALYVHGPIGCAFTLYPDADEHTLRKALAGELDVTDLGAVPHVATLMRTGPGDAFLLCTGYGSVPVGRATIQAMIDALEATGGGHDISGS